MKEERTILLPIQHLQSSPFTIHNSQFIIPTVPAHPRPKTQSRKLSLEDRILLLALAAAVPALLVAMLLLWRGDYTSKTQWTLTILIVADWLGFAFSIRATVTRPLLTLSNILAALREEDYPIRA